MIFRAVTKFTIPYKADVHVSVEWEWPTTSPYILQKITQSRCIIAGTGATGRLEEWPHCHRQFWIWVAALSTVLTGMTTRRVTTHGVTTGGVTTHGVTTHGVTTHGVTTGGVSK